MRRLKVPDEEIAGNARLFEDPMHMGLVHPMHTGIGRLSGRKTATVYYASILFCERDSAVVIRL